MRSENERKGEIRATEGHHGIAERKREREREMLKYLRVAAADQRHDLTGSSKRLRQCCALNTLLYVAVSTCLLSERCHSMLYRSSQILSLTAYCR